VKKPWGAGRVAFFARLDAIQAELAEGWPLTAIYQRHGSALGIGYRGFCRLVRKHAAGRSPARRDGLAVPVPVDAAMPGQAEAVRPAASANVPLSADPSAPIARGVAPNAGHQSARTFVHDPIERPGDYERLFGARKR
jgi:hypothetical protein